MLHFEIEPRRGYLYVTVTGELSIAHAEKALLEMLGVAARERQPRILVDCSRLQGEWNPDDRGLRDSAAHGPEPVLPDRGDEPRRAGALI